MKQPLPGSRHNPANKRRNLKARGTLLMMKGVGQADSVNEHCKTDTYKGSRQQEVFVPGPFCTHVSHRHSV